jgi:hypothetical protein
MGLIVSSVYANVGGNILDFKNAYVNLYLYPEAQFDLRVCMVRNLGSLTAYACSRDVIYAGMRGIILYLSSDYARNLKTINASKLGEYDIVNSDFDVTQYNIYVFVWDRLDPNQYAQIIAYPASGGYGEVVGYLKGPSAFVWLRDSQYAKIKAYVGDWYLSTQKVRVAVSNDSVTPDTCRLCLSLIDRIAFIPGTCRDLPCVDLDISAISL